ncbi:MAG: hypothetical protein ABIF77_00520, partial [bacterium]
AEATLLVLDPLGPTRATTSSSRSTLVYRLAAGALADPWQSVPTLTILGDSLSLAGCGVVCRDDIPPTGNGSERSWRQGWTFGPDPYNHAPVLHALCLGCCDYAVVRQQTVRDFQDLGLLDSVDWGVRELTDPLPDLVLLVAATWSPADRAQLQAILADLGQKRQLGQTGENEVLRGLAQVGLVGFEPLPESDFTRIREQFFRCWPRTGF